MKFEKLNEIEKMILTFIASASILGLIFCLINKTYYEGTYAREDGFLEWLTVYALALSSLLSFGRFFKLLGKKNLLFLTCLLGAGAVFLFGAGEEVSWGQRIFEIQSTEYFQQNNSQGEMNLHNLVVEGKKVNKVIFGTGLGIMVGLYLLVLPFLYDKKESVKKIVNKLAIPVAKNVHIISYVVLFILVSCIPSSKKGEVLEFGGCFLFFLMFRYPKNEEIYS